MTGRRLSDTKLLAAYGRRRGDNKWPRHLRDLWMVVLTWIMLSALQAQSGTEQHIQAGRRVGSAFTCSALGAVASAGRQVIIAGSAGPDTAFTLRLEKLGFPALKVRRAQALTAAQAYTQALDDAVYAQVGSKAKGIVNPNGTFNCKLVAKLASIPK